MATFIKYNKNEPIEIGDLISLRPDKSVVRSYQKDSKNVDENIIGVCTEVNHNQIEVQQEGYVIINIEGLYSIGSMVTASNIPGKAKALRYLQEKRLYNLREVGKVIEIYNDIKKAKILLDIE